MDQGHTLSSTNSSKGLINGIGPDFIQKKCLPKSVVIFTIRAILCDTYTGSRLKYHKDSSA